jgi:hypothetical protein
METRAGWRQWMETRAGRAASTSNLNLYKYLVYFFNVLPNFTLKIFLLCEVYF